MINALQFILIAVFLFVFYQDSKDRMVYWFLYPLCGILSYLVHALHVGYQQALANSFVNLSFVTVILLVAYVYSRIILKISFVNESMGSGDILLFIFLAFTFATVAYIILFVFSLCFSLALHLYFKNRAAHKNVPLAGYISLFFAMAYVISFFIEPKYLFA